MVNRFCRSNNVKHTTGRLTAFYITSYKGAIKKIRTNISQKVIQNPYGSRCEVICPIVEKWLKCMHVRDEETLDNLKADTRENLI